MYIIARHIKDQTVARSLNDILFGHHQSCLEMVRFVIKLIYCLDLFFLQFAHTLPHIRVLTRQGWVGSFFRPNVHPRLLAASFSKSNFFWIACHW